MPRKIRQFKKELQDLGFTERSGKGRHQVWKHPLLVSTIVIAAKDGSDVSPYLERQLKEVLRLLSEQEGS